MSAQRLNRQVLTDPSWWHWALTVPLLYAHLILERDGAIGVATGLCVVMTAYYLFRIRAIKPYPVQIRIAYTAWLLVGLLPGMSWMHWIQLFGTTAMVAIGYCPLARLLNLLPFNRSVPLTGAFIVQTFLRDSLAGGLLNLSRNKVATAACCSIRQPPMTAPCSVASTVVGNAIPDIRSAAGFGTANLIGKTTSDIRSL